MFIIRCLSRIVLPKEQHRSYRFMGQAVPVDDRTWYIYGYKYQHSWACLDFSFTPDIMKATAFRKMDRARAAVDRIRPSELSIRMFGMNAKYEIDRFYPEVFEVMNT